MKKMLIVLALLLFATVSQAQWVEQPFETCAADTFFKHPSVHSGLGTGNSNINISDVTTDPAPFSGSKSMKVEWTVHSTESWGGFAQMMHLQKQTDSVYLDFSSANALELHYYVVTPSSQPSLVNFRFKLHEAGGQANYWTNGSDHEDWYFQASGIYEATPGWKTLVIPLVDRGVADPNAEGFSLPGWSGQTNNGTLDLDKVIGYSIELTTPGIANNGTATGVIAFDALTFSGNRYTPITTFDGTVADTTFWAIDNMGWDGGNQGYVHLSDVTANPFEGASSLKIDYQVHMTQSWGGYVNLRHTVPNNGMLQDLTARTCLTTYIKVLEACTGTANRVAMRMMLFDVSDGAEEQWYHLMNVNIYQTSDWQKVVIPLVNLEGTGDDSKLYTTGFRIPSWESYSGNNVLNLDKIRAWKFEFSGTGDFGAVGEVAHGSLMVDLLTPGGWRETDVTGPNAPTGLLGVPGTYVNIVTWNDVPNENQETYSVYYSESPITDVNAPGVEVVKLNIPENTQLAEHLLRSAGTNATKNYYYAVVATDKAGNVGQLAALATKVTNTAKGVPTIKPLFQNATTFNFAADGDLSEFTAAGITPFVIKPSDGSGFIAPNTVITNDADLSAKVYIGIDNNNLYVAYDMEDDIISFVPTLASYYNDAPDLFIGLYNWHGQPHGSLRRGAEPDYHFRFAKDRALIDGTLDSLMGPGANYYWGEKFPTGYNVEARISLQDIATKCHDSLFVPRLGVRTPLDIEFNDADATGTREGILCYSPYNQDQSYQTTARWLYTWIGNQEVVDAKEATNSVVSYQLSQNYPNPFNPSTMINFSLEKAGHVSLKVYDVLGRLVTTLVDGEQTVGNHTVSFNASKLASGLYFYTIEAGNFRATKKMMLVK